MKDRKVFTGAEATVEIGNKKVIKKREPKKYRHENLDKKIREERTKTEDHLINKARKYGVKTPKTEKKSKYTLEIEKISGKPLKNCINHRTEILEDLGKNVAYLHSTDIIHGDLTTSNIVVNNDPYLIDFGLSSSSERLEDKAVDIHLLKQVIESSHPKVAEEAWKHFKQGYSTYEKSDKVLEQLRKVEKRGRYK